MSDRDQDGPLSEEAVRRIDASPLPQRDRHHLRLLAHCLASFQAMEPLPANGELPKEQARRQWCLSQQLIADDPHFIALMLEQLDVAALQLESIAETIDTPPIELTIDDLIALAQKERNS